MNKMSNERRLTVSYYRDSYAEDVPFLRLKGKWLRDSGFIPGTHVKVFVLRDHLIISKDNDTDYAKLKKQNWRVDEKY